MKRVLLVIAAIVVIVAAAAGAVFYSAFANNRPIQDGQTLAPGVTVVKDGFVSVDILDAGGGKAVLIDAGNDKAGKAILAALAARNLTPASVVGIFLTHGHPDHTAACKQFPNAEI